MTGNPITAILGLLALLFFALSIGPAVATIDTSEYEEVVGEIAEKEAALDEANSEGDINRVIGLTKELDKLHAKLREPDMVFLAKYSKLEKFWKEGEKLMGKLGELVDSDGEYNKINDMMDAAEREYNEGNYSGALEILKGGEEEILELPAEICKEAAKGVSDAAGYKPMLENARGILREAASLYSEAAEKVRRGYKTEGEEIMDKASGVVDEACGLIKRAGREDRTVGIILLIGAPTVVGILLIAYLYIGKSRIVLKVSTNPSTIKAGEEAKIERKISVINMKNRSFSIVISETPPDILSPEEFSIPPSESSGGRIEWRVFLKAGGRVNVSYILSAPKLERGKEIKIPGTVVVYEDKGRICGKSTKVRVIGP